MVAVFAGGVSGDGQRRTGPTRGAGQKPQRIVVLGPALYAYMLVDLGAADRVVGITQSADNPLEMQSLPSLGQPLSPDLERIVKLAPDLVLGGTDTVQKQLLSLSIPCYAGGRARAGIVSSQDVFALVRAVGQLVFGDGVAAEKLIEDAGRDVVC